MRRKPPRTHTAVGGVVTASTRTGPSRPSVSPRRSKRTYRGTIAACAGTASPATSTPKMARPTRPGIRAQKNAAGPATTSVSVTAPAVTTALSANAAPRPPSSTAGP
ncbi:hypothetical protein ACF09K_32010 [Streptomyces sp. NPDC014882]|uniref:hypothetical protein n=1 Tax=Streptomyces sp. NPDC014882 TaxID=3364927 RepID=UPI00370257DE